MKRQPNKSFTRKSSSMERRLTGYGVMSMAIAAALAPNANADIVLAVPDVTTPVNGGIYFGLTTLEATTVGSNSLAPGSSPGRFALENLTSGSFEQAFIVGAANNGFAVTRAAGASSSHIPTSAARLALNTVIGPALNFQNPKTLTSVGGSSFPNSVFPSLADNGVGEGQWNALGSDFLGLVFENGSQTDYGWAEITINPDYTVTLDAMAYDDSGAPIQAGEAPAPEPGSMLLMALGAAGLAALRRRRAAQTAEQTHS